MSKKLRNQKAARANRYLDHYMNMPPDMDYLPYRFGAGTYARLTFRMEQTKRRRGFRGQR